VSFFWTACRRFAAADRGGPAPPPGGAGGGSVAQRRRPSAQLPCALAASYRRVARPGAWARTRRQPGSCTSTIATDDTSYPVSNLTCATAEVGHIRMALKPAQWCSWHAHALRRDLAGLDYRRSHLHAQDDAAPAGCAGERVHVLLGPALLDFTVGGLKPISEGHSFHPAGAPYKYLYGGVPYKSPEIAENRRKSELQADLRWSLILPPTVESSCAGLGAYILVCIQLYSLPVIDLNLVRVRLCTRIV
jgi:hypothetical protein